VSYSRSCVFSESSIVIISERVVASQLLFLMNYNSTSVKELKQSAITVKTNQQPRTQLVLAVKH